MDCLTTRGSPTFGLSASPSLRFSSAELRSNIPTRSSSPRKRTSRNTGLARSVLLPHLVLALCHSYLHCQIRGKWVGSWKMTKSIEKLLRRMISPNADLRCTATQAINDPYWKEVASAASHSKLPSRLLRQRRAEYREQGGRRATHHPSCSRRSCPNS